VQGVSTSRDTLSCPRLVARSVRPPSGTAGQWYDKPNFHTIEPLAGQVFTGLHLAAQPGYICNIYDTGQKSVCIVAKTLIHKEDV